MENEIIISISPRAIVAETLLHACIKHDRTQLAFRLIAYDWNIDIEARTVRKRCIYVYITEKVVCLC